MSTMQDVARRAGVSAKTVSRVFNDDPHVLPDTRERVEAAMRELNYVPNALARVFRHGRSHTVGVAVPDVGDPFFSAIVRAVETVCAPAGVTTLVTSIGDDPRRERDVLETLLKAQLMGLILAPVAADQSWLTSWLAHTPIVFVDRAPSGVAADVFSEDDVAGARAAATHLASHGHRRIAFVADRLHPPSTTRRRRGWAEGLREAGLSPADELVSYDLVDPRASAAAVTSLRNLSDPPTAAVVANARVTMDAFRPLTDAGLAFVGLGDFPMAHDLTPAVSVMSQDPTRLGRLAAERALARFADPAADLPTSELLPMTLVERASCRVGAPHSDAGGGA